MASSSGRFVVYPPSQKATTYAAAVSTPSSRRSTDTPSHVVPSFDHLVTQWMSLVISSEGNARNSSHDHALGSSTSPSIVRLHSARGVRGVGPADRTGKPSTRYWPGGIRTSPSGCLRRPRKPREMNPPLTNVPPTVVLRRGHIHSGTPPKAGSNMCTRGSSCRHLKPPVHLPAMPYPDDDHIQHLVLDGVDDPVVAGAHTPVVVAFHLLGSRRPRF